MALFAGCAGTTSQTREELKTNQKNRTLTGFYSTYTANHPFGSVVSTIERKWQQCYNVGITTTHSSGGQQTMKYRDSFHPKARKVNDSLVEMTLQKTTEGMVMLNKIPPGGEYRIALDIERLPGNKTKLTWYSPSVGNWKKSWERNKKWSEGKDVDCEE